MIESLRFRAEFDAIRASGTVRRSGPLALRSVPTHAPRGDGTPKVRIAFAVNKTVGTAVVRNRVRRRLRALLGEFDAVGAISPGMHLMVVAPQAVSMSFSELRHHVNKVIAT